MSPRLMLRVDRIQWLGTLALVALVQLAFWQQSGDPFLPVETLALKVLVPLCVLPLLARGDVRALARNWGVRLLLAWVAWFWVRAILSPFAQEGLKTALEYTLEATLFPLAVAVPPTRRRELVAAFFAASLAACAYGLVQHWGLDPLLWSTEFGGRPLGTVGNPDFFGGHLVLAWGVGLAWLLAAPRGRRGLPLAALAALSLVQAYSLTVGAWLGMAVSAAAVAAFLLAPAGEWVRVRRAWTRGAVAAVLAAALLAAGAAVSVGPGGRALRGFAQSKSLSVVNRTLMWRVALKLWAGAPVTGAGVDSFRPQYPQLQADLLHAEPDRGWNYVVTWLPHENFLYLGCETGAVGLGLFLAFWATALAAGWRRAAGGDGWALACGTGAAGLLGVGLLNTFSNIPPTAVGLFLLLGCASGPAETPAPQTDGRGAWEALAVALGLALALGLAGGRELSANRFMREAGRADTRGDPASAADLYGRASDLHVANLSMQSLVGVDFDLAQSLRQLGHLDAAVAAYRADLKVNPWAPEGHNMLGAALGQLGQQEGRADWVDEGAEHLRTAVRLSPGYTAALLNLGGSYAVMGNVSGAAEAWQEALRSDTSNAQARAYLAQLRPGR